MRNVNKHIEEYKAVIQRNENKDFTASDFYQIKEMSEDVWDAIFNACMFGFAVGYRTAKSEDKEERC